MAQPQDRSFGDKSVIGIYQPVVGDVVCVKAFGGMSGIFAEITEDNREGYCLKYPSPDCLQVLHKTVRHYVDFARSQNTLPQIVAKMFWSSGLQAMHDGVVFKRWQHLPRFFQAWGELGLCELLLIAHPTIGANNDFVPRVKLLQDKSLIKWLAESAEFPAVREAAASVLLEH